MSTKIHQLPLGPMDNLIYIIEDEASKKAAVVDPAWDVPHIIYQLEGKDLSLEIILLTHGHPDHVNGLNALLEHKSVPVYLSKDEHPIITPNVPQLHKVTDNETIQLGDTTINCIHTPGHSPGGQCFLIDPHLITGDTLFIGACGRTDLPGGDAPTLYNSLARLKSLPDHLIVYPGHHYGKNSTDTLGHQKEVNPYLTATEEKTFIKKRTGF